jgi:predicted Ser/Thr protein kinase
VRELSIGDIFAGHRLEAVLGRGGMGIVYLAMHERLKHRRALKVISPAFSSDEQFRRRFERESEVAASLEHEHVIPIYDAGEDEGQLYIAMRYIKGTDMHELIQGRGTLDPRSTSLVVNQMASALDAAHGRGLVHRDVKPANVLIASKGDADHSYLTDFGLTKMVGKELSKLTATGTILGTLDYIAPEQLDGVAIPASDVYSLGCLTFHALSGEVPYPQPAAPAKMWAHINAAPPLLEDGRAGASEVLARAMAKDPADRFSTAGDFARALAETLEEPVTRARPAKPPRSTLVAAPPTEVDESSPPIASSARVAPPPTPPSTAGRRLPPALRRRGLMAAAALLIVVGATVGVVSALSGGQGKEGAGNRKPVSKPRQIAVSATPSGAIPQPAETMGDAGRRLAWLFHEAAAGRCGPMKRFNKTSLLDLFCRPLERGKPNGLTGFKVTGVKRLGTGGIVEFVDDFTRHHKPNLLGVFIMALDATGRFTLTGPEVKRLPTQVGTPHGNWRRADSAAVGFLESVRDRDCSRFFNITLTPDYTNKQAKACRELLDVAYARLRTALLSAEKVDLFHLRATSRLFFYGLRLGREYRTLVIGRCRMSRCGRPKHGGPPLAPYNAYGTVLATADPASSTHLNDERPRKR